jgi:transglutaminase/protease-like cytokinesis protein 3
MKFYKILPVCSLLLLSACGDDSSSSVNGVDSGDPASSETVEQLSSSSQSGNAPESSAVADATSSSSQKASNSSSSQGSVKQSSSSQNVGNSSSSSQSTATPESSSMTETPSSSSQSSSSQTASNSSSSESPESSSSEVLTDPLKIFDIRVPNQKAIHCEDKGAYTSFEKDVEESDLICSFKYKDEEGFVYVQNNPIKCVGSDLYPIYEVHKAEFYVNGSMQEISNVSFHGGGNHGIYGIEFTYNGKVFKYDYSTMGMGGRPCQDVDCMTVYESDGKTLIQDGCTEERTLPIVCRPAREDGTFASFVDTYHVCRNDWDITLD